MALERSERRIMICDEVYRQVLYLTSWLHLEARVAIVLVN
jgi:hypothetical protein